MNTCGQLIQMEWGFRVPSCRQGPGTRQGYGIRKLLISYIIVLYRSLRNTEVIYVPEITNIQENCTLSLRLEIVSLCKGNLRATPAMIVYIYPIVDAKNSEMNVYILYYARCEVQKGKNSIYTDGRKYHFPQRDPSDKVA